MKNAWQDFCKDVRGQLTRDGFRQLLLIWITGFSLIFFCNVDSYMWQWWFMQFLVVFIGESYPRIPFASEKRPEDELMEIPED